MAEHTGSRKKSAHTARLSWTYFVLGSLAVLASEGLGMPRLVQDAVYDLISFSLVLAILFGVRRYRPRSLLAWYLMAAGQGLWYVVWMPAAFLGYCVGVLGFTVWGPLRAPAGDDIATGVLAELSGVDRLLIAAGRYALLVAGGAFAVPLFLGGTDGPWLPGVVWLVLKTAAVVALLVVVGERGSVVRPDKVLEAGWVVILPLVIVQDLVVAVITVAGSS